MEARGFAWIGPLAALMTLAAFGVMPAAAFAAGNAAVPDAGASSAAPEPPAIEMSAGCLHVWVSAESTRVECVYVLRNSGDSTRVRMPFPATLIELDGVPRIGMFSSIESFVDGTPVNPHTEPAPDDQRPAGRIRCYLEPVSFAAHQTRVVRDVYSGDGPLELSMHRMYGYELFTGRVWSGPVGPFDVVLTLDLLRPDDEVVRTLPAATSHRGREWRWHFDGVVPGMGKVPSIEVWWRSRGSRICSAAC